LKKLIRTQGGLVWVPELVGTATQPLFFLARYSGRAELVRQPLHHIVDVLQRVSLIVYFPVVECVDVVPGLRLRLGGAGHQQLVAVASDEIDADLDLVLVGPGIDLLLHDVVAGGDPMVPEADSKLSGGSGGADMHQRQCRRGRPQLQGAATRDLS
jgi:hypothetical protein